MVTLWFTILAASILLYVLLDGFDLGVGMLFGLTRSEAQRSDMLAAVEPVWDGNETWLVSAGTVLWAGFPLAFATLLSALYLPVLIMLAGLILRGVAFVYLEKAQRTRWLWVTAFAVGSLAAAFMQGLMVGALVEELPISNGQYVGGDLGWLSPFAIFCGLGLCVGYTLLGACWLVKKCEGETRDAAYRVIPNLALVLSVLLVEVFLHAFSGDLRITERWVERPYLFIFPLIGMGAAVAAALSVRRRRDEIPFFMGLVIFAAAFGTFAISFWPYIIPFSITVAEAAAPPSSLAFMFWGAGLFVFPLMLVYTTIGYAVFRGKIGRTAHY